MSEQSKLERVLRSYLWQPTDRLVRAKESLPGHVRKKEYREAGDCQVAIRKAEAEICQWQSLIDLYTEEINAIKTSANL